MPQSLAKVAVHLVYSTKHRAAYLNEPELRAELYAYKAAILKNNVDSPAILIGGMPDHVHILCLLSRKFAIKDVVEEVKQNQQSGSNDNRLHWQIFIGKVAMASSLSVSRISSRLNST